MKRIKYLKKGRHLLEKNGTLKIRQIPNNFLEKIPEKYLGISEISFIKFTQKSVNLVTIVLRISQEFPNKNSGEILGNFLGKNPEEFFCTLILLKSIGR